MNKKIKKFIKKYKELTTKTNRKDFEDKFSIALIIAALGSLVGLIIKNPAIILSSFGIGGLSALATDIKKDIKSTKKDKKILIQASTKQNNNSIDNTTKNKRKKLNNNIEINIKTILEYSAIKNDISLSDPNNEIAALLSRVEEQLIKMNYPEEKRFEIIIDIINTTINKLKKDNESAINSVDFINESKDILKKYMFIDQINNIITNTSSSKKLN